MLNTNITVFALISLMALSLPLIAEEVYSDPAASAQGEYAVTSPSAAGDDPMSAMQARWSERDARYRELVERAREVGVMLPEDPPWKERRREMMSDMAEHMSRRQAMMSMTPEERMAAREAEYQERNARAAERGIQMPDTPPWESGQMMGDEEWAQHQAVIDGMSDEERAACHAMHRRHMGSMMREMPERPRMRSMMGPGMMGSERMRPGWGPGSMGPGYGQGANPYYAPQNFWDPNR